MGKGGWVIAWITSDVPGTLCWHIGTVTCLFKPRRSYGRALIQRRSLVFKIFKKRILAFNVLKTVHNTQKIKFIQTTPKNREFSRIIICVLPSPTVRMKAKWEFANYADFSRFEGGFGFLSTGYNSCIIETFDTSRIRHIARHSKILIFWSVEFWPVMGTEHRSIGSVVLLKWHMGIVIFHIYLFGETGFVCDTEGCWCYCGAFQLIRTLSVADQWGS